MKRLILSCGLLAIGLGCDPGRFDLGRGPIGATSPDARPDGGTTETCAQVAGSYTIDQLVANCMGLAATDPVEVRQQGCALVFPGPAIEGQASLREDGRWDAQLRVGQRMVSCFVKYFEVEGLLELGCGSICYLVLRRS